MKIETQENAINFDELQSTLSKHFSDKYEVSTRVKNLLVVAKTKTIGTTVHLGKKALVVNGNFSTMKSQMVFTICVVAAGILIPLIVYFSVYHKKMKVVENEVGEFLKMHYQSKLI